MQSNATTDENNTTFTLCQSKDSLQIFPYRSLEYKGHQRALRKELTHQLELKNLNFADGYLFVSYYINCKGDAGKFTIDGMDLNYKKKTFDETILQAVQSSIEDLTNWKLPYNKEGEKLDASYSMTFKFKNDKIENIIL